MSTIRKIVSKKVTKALWDFEMISPGDRILVAVSGGKDSTVLLQELAGRRPHWPVPFELGALHIKSDFAAPAVEPFVRRICAEAGVDLSILNVDVHGRLKPGRRMNCYWCSLQRRTELMEFARQNGYQKIAFGHHLDDTIETYFMNLMQLGKHNQGMSPNLRLDHYPLAFIRPLVYVEERELIEYVQAQDLLRFTCHCEYGENSERKRVRRIIAELTENQSGRKQNILRAAISTPQQPMTHTG